MTFEKFQSHNQNAERGSWEVTYKIFFVQHGMLIGVGRSTVRRAPALDVHLSSASKYLQSTLSSSIHIHSGHNYKS